MLLTRTSLAMMTRRDKEAEETLGVDRAQARINIRRKGEKKAKGHDLLIH